MGTDLRWKRTIYCSHATLPLDQPIHLAEILGASSRNNKYDGITGALVLTDGIFIQVIEGPPGAVDRLMVRLQADKRHRDLTVLGEEVDSRRMFNEWLMETPALRPDHKAALTALTGQCEKRYDDALQLMLELVNGVDGSVGATHGTFPIGEQ